MTSTFFGLDIALRALRAQQTLVDVANQNIANANTPGYSRQVASLRTTLPFPVPAFNALGQPGQLGTGVAIAEITRVRDTFVDYQMRGELAAQGRWAAQSDALKQVETIFNEPSATGLSSLLGKYWQAWQEVANSPSDEAVRTNVIEQGKAVAEAFRRLDTQLTTLQRDLDQQVQLTVTDVNNLASQIAAVNQQIARVETAGLRANDLRDQRDQLVDDLSKLARVTYAESADGQLSVYLGSRQLVDRDQVRELVAKAPPDAGFVEVLWKDGEQPAVVPDGRLKGLLDARDTSLQTRIDQLNDLARRLAESVNGIHTSGVGLGAASGSSPGAGVAFFTVTAGREAQTIEVGATVAGDPTQVAAARAIQNPTPPPAYLYPAGDSSNAIAIAALQNSLVQRLTTTATPRVEPGAALFGGSVTVAGLDVSGAPPGAAYTLSSTAGSNLLTLTQTVGPQAGQSATLDVAALGTAGTLAVFDALGVRLTLLAGATASPANVAAGTGPLGLELSASRSTINDQYGAQIAALGVASRSAQAQTANQDVLINQLKRQREATSGVSIDEETTNLIAYQRAYQAAARVVSVMDEMLNTLVNGTGVVGR